MRYLLLLSFCALLCACSDQRITRMHFEAIPLGASREEVLAKIGKPWYRKGDEEIYVEKIPLSKEQVLHWQYHFRYAEGRLVQKSQKELVPPALKLDAYP